MSDSWVALLLFVVLTTLLVLYVWAASYVADEAKRKGWSYWFFLLAGLFVVSPAIMYIIVMLATENERKLIREGLKDGTLKRCPHCKSPILAGASVCSECGRDV